MSETAILHTKEYKQRRFLNWFPMGLTYAFLYMARYNLTVAKNALGDAMTKEDFGVIFAVGTFTYAFAFLLNGPLVDKIGGRRGMLIAAMGSAICNIAMGLYIQIVIVSEGAAATGLVPILSVAYAVNMYFQSYGAVSIVKVNAHWFHVNERGGFSGIFGTMITSGIFFAFTVNGWILDAVTPKGAVTQLPYTMWVFYVPAAVLLAMWLVEFFLLRDRPGLAGHADFDTGDASSGDDGADVSVFAIIKRIMTNPIILTVALIEFCTGILRNGVMHWWTFYAKEVLVLPSKHFLVNGDWFGKLDLANGEFGNFVYIVPCFLAAAIFFFFATRAKTGKSIAWYTISGALLFLAPFSMAGWGGFLMVAGVIGANVAGWVSDLFFQSRRAPAAGGLYGGLVLCTVVMFFVLGGPTATVGRVPPPKEDAPQQLDHLEIGDTIVSVAGVSSIEDWTDVSKAIACYPANCKEDRWTWDLKECTCSSKPDEPAGPGLATTDGTIPVTVERAGKTVQLTIADPMPEMRAGDKRKLKEAPILVLNPVWLGLVIFLMSLCVIGTHGLLSGTATMDFGGRRGAATAVGMIDGFVYLGTGVQSLALGYLTTRDWSYWPIFLFPFGVIGFFLCLRIWNAKPGSKGGAH